MAAGNLSGTTADPAVNRVVTLARKDSSTLAALRLVTGVEVAEADNLLWVRVRQADASTLERLQKLPAVERYKWMDGDRLCRFGSLISCDQLPSLVWQTVAAWLKVSLPRPAMSSERRPMTDVPNFG